MTSKPIDSEPLSVLARRIRNLDLLVSRIINNKNVNLPFRNAANLPAQAADGDLIIVGTSLYARIAGTWEEIVAGGGGAGVLQTIHIPGALETLTGTATWEAAADGEISFILVNVGVAPTGSAVTGDVKKNGSSIFAYSIAAGADSDQDVPSATAFVAGDEFTVDITAIGSTTPGTDLSTQFWGTYA